MATRALAAVLLAALISPVSVVWVGRAAEDEVPKSIGWFAGRPSWGSGFLLDDHPTLADRLIPCCSGMWVNASGHLQRAPGFPDSLTPYGNLSLFQRPGSNIQDILMNFFVKDAALAIPAMHARRESFAAELLAIALRYNVSFIMDWEFPQAVPWVLFNETMTVVSRKLATSGKTLSLTIQSGCGDTIPGYGAVSNPPCGTLFRSMPWAHKLVDMGTYQLTDSLANDTVRQRALKLRPCPAPLNKITEWCGLEGQVLNHLHPIVGEVAAGVREYPMGAANGQYSAAFWPINCEQNGTVAGGWTNSTLHAFLVFLDSVHVRSVDVFCTGAAVPCPTLLSGQCTWFLDQLQWWKKNQ
jgi:hypothetical protein